MNEEKKIKSNNLVTNYKAIEISKVKLQSFMHDEYVD